MPQTDPWQFFIRLPIWQLQTAHDYVLLSRCVGAGGTWGGHVLVYNIFLNPRFSIIRVGSPDCPKRIALFNHLDMLALSLGHALINNIAGFFLLWVLLSYGSNTLIRIRYGSKPVLIQRLTIGFKDILEMSLWLVNCAWNHSLEVQGGVQLIQWQQLSSTTKILPISFNSYCSVIIDFLRGWRYWTINCTVRISCFWLSNFGMCINLSYIVLSLKIPGFDRYCCIITESVIIRDANCKLYWYPKLDVLRIFI